MDYKLSPTAQYEKSVSALLPYQNADMRNMTNVQQRQINFDPSAYGVQLGEGVIAIPFDEGFKFVKESPDAPNAQSFYTGNYVDNESTIRGIRTDYSGNPFEKKYFTAYGTPYDQNELSSSTGSGISFSPQSGQFDTSLFSNPVVGDFLQREAQNIAQYRGISSQAALPSAVHSLNLYAGDPNLNYSNVSASQNYIRQQRKKGNSFGSRLKEFAGVAAPVLLAPVAAGLGSAFAGSLGAGTAASTGVAAGGAASGGLGSLFSGFVAPQALSGAITGGLGALASGGDFGDALKGAALGGVGGGFGSAIGSSLGLGALGQQALTGGLTGAAGGLATGDMKAALIGAGLGAGGGYLKGGGEVPFLGSAKQQLPAGVYGAPKQGTGFLGGLTNATNTGLTIGGQPMKLGSLLSAGGDLYGMYQGQKDIDEIQDIYEQQAARAQAQFDPYAQAGQTALANMQAPSMEALQNDPGYQFRLGQGQQAVERSLAARGLGQSGAALKAAQEYGQGLADQTYQDFFNRQGQIANQGFNAAQGLGSIYGGLGNAQAAATMQGINNRNQGLSNLFGGFGGGDEYLDGSLSRLLGGLF